ncbi:MAG TPA: hypothetical protein VK665_15610, partial [Candidatus Elarobacter sp.]|nr:hypothetical protein [Candidatus Elarobacter sp.]
MTPDEITLQQAQGDIAANRDSTAVAADPDVILSLSKDAPQPRTRLWIDGAYADAASGETYDDVDPATGETFARIAS